MEEKGTLGSVLESSLDSVTQHRLKLTHPLAIPIPKCLHKITTNTQWPLPNAGHSLSAGFYNIFKNLEVIITNCIIYNTIHKYILIQSP